MTKREKPGQPPLEGGAVRATITLSKPDLEYLTSLHPKLSKAVRLLIRRAQSE